MTTFSKSLFFYYSNNIVPDRNAFLLRSIRIPSCGVLFCVKCLWMHSKQRPPDDSEYEWNAYGTWTQMERVHVRNEIFKVKNFRAPYRQILLISRFISAIFVKFLWENSIFHLENIEVNIELDPRNFTKFSNYRNTPLFVPIFQPPILLIWKALWPVTE